MNLDLKLQLFGEDLCILFDLLFRVLMITIQTKQTNNFIHSCTYMPIDEVLFF